MMSFIDLIDMKENQDRLSSFSEIDEAILKAFAIEPFFLHYII
jgi:hypothetical protein